MIARNETIFKWALYAAAAALCFFVQGSVLQRIALWGVIPFLYPLAAAIPATFEPPFPATVFGLCVGLVCDLLLPGSIPCFYTLVFPLAGLCASLLSQGALPAGCLCSLAASAIAFAMTGLLHSLVLLAVNGPAWGAAASVTLREFCVTAPFTVPATALFRAVWRRVHRDD